MRLLLQAKVPSLVLIAICIVAASPATNDKSNAGRILKFLQSIPQSARTEMEDILQNTTLTKGEMEHKLDQWAAKQPGNFPTQYNEMKGLLNSSAAKSLTKNNEKPLSNSAEQAIADIRQNKSITRLSERKAILEILAKEPIDKNTNTFVLPNNNLNL